MHGVVKEYNRKKQVGFTHYNAESHKKKAFCNKTDLANIDYLIKGDNVDFIVSKDGCACDIFLLRKES